MPAHPIRTAPAVRRTSRTLPGLIAALIAAGPLASPSVAEELGLGFLPLPHTASSHQHYDAREAMGGQQSRDLRAEGLITPARHQGSCGACWAFAAVTCIETACLMTNPALDASSFDLSEQQLVSCDDEVWQLAGLGSTRNYGCGGGSAVTFEYVRTYGIAFEEDYPYTSGGSGTTGACPATLPSACGWQVVDWGFVRPDAGTPSTSEMKAALDLHGAIWAGFTVYPDFMDGAQGGFWYTGDEDEIYSHDVVQARIGYHAVAVIGYDDLRGCWLAKNSWGESAGPNGDGTFWIAYSAGCGFGLNAAWVAVDFFGPASPVHATTWGALKSRFLEP